MSLTISRRRGDRLRPRPGGRVAKPPGGAADEADALENVLRALRPEAPDPGQPAVEAGPLERVQRVDAERVEQSLDLLGAEPGHPQTLPQSRRERRAQLVVHRQLAGRHEGLDVAEDRRADAGDVSKRSRPDGLGEVALVGQQRAGRILVRADLERVRPRQLQHARDLVEDARDLVAVHEGDLSG
jgi:hypothetical protein